MKKLAGILLCFCFLRGFLFSSNFQGNQLQDLALQTIPFYEGTEEFSQKLEKIRQEEGREPLCLVLCGGSARAFCHTGVLRAMEEKDIVPDFIVANSMGAVIGMLYAYGFSPQKIEELISEVELTSYFEPVFPTHGGLLSVRHFQALLDQLLGEESHRIEDCPIPILLLSEDLYTKRQVWHCCGDFSTIMTAAFAMSVFMEPVKCTLECGEQAGRKVSLIDSGSIDIAGLKVAGHFSKNIIVSSAFYDSDLDFNNPIVIINRTMSIGKERIAIQDILDMEPVLIRNAVEQFSFMDFQKSSELGQAGYDTAITLMKEIEACPHGGLLQNEKLVKQRKITDELTDRQIFKVKHGFPVRISQPYLGLKFWPVFAAVDFQDSYLFDRDGIACDTFLELPGAMLKLRVNQPFTFDSICSDALLQFTPSKFLKAEFLASYSFSYDDFYKSSFYGLADININPAFFPVWCNSMVFTTEWLTDYRFNTERLLFTAGFKNLFGDKNDSYLFVKPYVYTDLIEEKLTPGLGLDLESCWNFAPYAGGGEYAYAKYNFNTKIISLKNRNELYFVNKSPDFTFAEVLILRQFKLGAYYELDTSFAGAEPSLGHFAGAFLRSDVSIIGLSNLICEAACGWNFAEKKVYGHLDLRCRM